MQAGDKVLVTGGAGFVGVNLLPLLLERGYRVTVLDNLSVGTRERVADFPVELVVGDVRDAALLQETLPGHAGVIHLAGQTGVPGSLADPFEDCSINVLGTLTVLDAIRRAAAPAGRKIRFVFASSNAPLGRQQPPATEDKAPLPISPYGASKLAAEAYCLAYNGSWGLDTVALRFGNVYGPHSEDKQSVVTKFLNDLTHKGKLTIYGDGQQTRDFIYVADICRAIVAALESKVSGEIFQIATGAETSILELAQLLQRAVGTDISLQHEAARQGDIRQNYSGVSKARKLLGWEAQVGIAEGVGRTWDWYAATRGLRGA